MGHLGTTWGRRRARGLAHFRMASGMTLSGETLGEKGREATSRKGSGEERSKAIGAKGMGHLGTR